MALLLQLPAASNLEKTKQFRHAPFGRAPPTQMRGLIQGPPPSQQGRRMEAWIDGDRQAARGQWQSSNLESDWRAMAAASEKVVGASPGSAACAVTSPPPRVPPDGSPNSARGRRGVGLALEGTVCWEGRLTHFVARNLEERIRRSSSGGGASTGSSAPERAIPAVDAQAVQDLAALAVRVAAQVDELLRSAHGALQAMTALSVGCIQTYRDGVENLGEAVDASIRSMYALMARCEELDKQMQPVPALARSIRDLKSALDTLEGLCK